MLFVCDHIFYDMEIFGDKREILQFNRFPDARTFQETAIFLTWNPTEGLFQQLEFKKTRSTKERRENERIAS